MPNIAFGQNKYYVDNLSENIRRGIRQKLHRGERYGFAPLRYLNDPRTRKIVKDPQRRQSVRQLFEVYAAGKQTPEGIRDLSGRSGLVSKAKGTIWVCQRLRQF